RLRKDDPSMDLNPPSILGARAKCTIDQGAVKQMGQVFAILSPISTEATGLRAFVAARVMAILHLTAAGARCCEIAALNIADVERAASANGVIHLGPMR